MSPEALPRQTFQDTLTLSLVVGSSTQVRLAAWGLMHDHERGGWTKWGMDQMKLSHWLCADGRHFWDCKPEGAQELLDQHEKAESMNQWEDGEGLE